VIQHIEKLQNSHLKNTPKRREMIAIFLKSDKLLTPEDVFFRLKKKFSHCGLPSVYRNLEALADCGVLARIQKFDNKRYYGLCHEHADTHHHHIVCIKCGKMGEVDGCGFLKKKEISGFQVTGHFLQLNGICADCRKKKVKR